MKKIIILIFLVTSFCARSQSFKKEASIKPVGEDGFYNILLSPDVSRDLNDALNDIRVLDEDEKEVPYMFKMESSSIYSEHFVEYTIVEKESKRNCCTSVILQNATRTPINNIHLVIKNAEASRTASLLGSDDRKNWFSIKDQFRLRAPQSSTGTQEIKIVGFPWSNYEYYRVQIQDSIHAPLNILKAGYYEPQLSQGNFSKLPVRSVTTDSAKATFVELTFDSNQFVDRLEIEVSGIKYYRREASLLQKRVRTSKNGSRTEYYSPVANFELTTGRKAVVDLKDMRGQKFLIQIQNDDNPPLTISSVNAFQLNRYLTVWLKKDKQYTVKFGQRNLKPAVYDLVFFRDSIPSHIPVVNIDRVTNVEVSSIKESKAFFTNKNLIWVAIIVVVSLMGYMSIKLVRESSAETKE